MSTIFKAGFFVKQQEKDNANPNALLDQTYMDYILYSRNFTSH